MKSVKRAALSALAGVGLSIAAIGTSALPANAASNGSIGVYQVGLSFNCDKASASASPACGHGGLGGMWGWWEFDSPNNNPNSGIGGDGQATFCGHGGGFSGAGHTAYDFTDWYIAPDPNSGLPTFFASWTETDYFQGQTETFKITDESTGVPAVTIHRQVLQLFGVPTPPGASINVQVSWKPAN